MEETIEWVIRAFAVIGVTAAIYYYLKEVYSVNAGWKSMNENEKRATARLILELMRADKQVMSSERNAVMIPAIVLIESKQMTLEEAKSHFKSMSPREKAAAIKMFNNTIEGDDWRHDDEDAMLKIIEG